MKKKRKNTTVQQKLNNAGAADSRKKKLRNDIVVIGVIIITFLVMIGLFISKFLTGDSSNQSNGSKQLQQGTTVGENYFPDGDSSTGGSGSPVDGIDVNQMENINFHIHVHLSLFYNGKQIAIPKGIGILPPRVSQSGFVTRGAGFYWIHTHDATGIIHVEAPAEAQYTLGNFFDIWGQPLEKGNIAGFTGPVHVFLNGQPYTDDLKKIPLTRHQEITIEVGAPVVPPPSYLFPDGL